jgi:hypothetical protein
MDKKEIIWATPTPSQQSDSLDLAIIAIGYIHGKAWNDGVLLSDEIYAQILNEFLELRQISKTLTPSERLVVCLYLDNGITGISLLDFLLNILKTRE